MTTYLFSPQMIRSLLLGLLTLTFFACEGESLGDAATNEVVVEGQLAEVTQAPVPENWNEIRMAIGYPDAAAQQGIEGMVVARVLVDKDGRYLRHELVKNDHVLLGDAVETELKALRFSPAHQDGEAVQAWVMIPFNFKLQ